VVTQQSDRQVERPQRTCRCRSSSQQPSRARKRKREEDFLL